MTGDYQQRGRHPAERLARMEGTTTFRTPRDGWGGIVDLTDQDAMAALALCRRRSPDSPECDLGDIGPELIETYYASTMRHFDLICRAYLRSLPHKAPDAHACSVMRFAAEMGARIIGGCAYSEADRRKMAWRLCCKRETLDTAMRLATGWYWARLDYAVPRFKAVMQEIKEHCRQNMPVRRAA